MQGGRVVSDGHTPHDLAHITIEKLQEATGLDISDFYALYEKYVLQLEQADVVKQEPLLAVESTVKNAQFAEDTTKKPRTK